MKKTYCPPRSELIMMSTYGDVALGVDGSNSTGEETQLSKPTFANDEEGLDMKHSLWSDDTNE